MIAKHIIQALMKVIFKVLFEIVKFKDIVWPKICLAQKEVYELSDSSK